MTRNPGAFPRFLMAGVAGSSQNSAAEPMGRGSGAAQRRSSRCRWIIWERAGEITSIWARVRLGIPIFCGSGKFKSFLCQTQTRRGSGRGREGGKEGGKEGGSRERAGRGGRCEREGGGTLTPALFLAAVILSFRFPRGRGEGEKKKNNPQTLPSPRPFYFWDLVWFGRFLGGVCVFCTSPPRSRTQTNPKVPKSPKSWEYFRSAIPFGPAAALGGGGFCLAVPRVLPAWRGKGILPFRGEIGNFWASLSLPASKEPQFGKADCKQIPGSLKAGKRGFGTAGIHPHPHPDPIPLLPPSPSLDFSSIPNFQSRDIPAQPGEFSFIKLRREKKKKKKLKNSNPPERAEGGLFGNCGGIQHSLLIFPCGEEQRGWERVTDPAGDAPRGHPAAPGSGLTHSALKIALGGVLPSFFLLFPPPFISPFPRGYLGAEG
ncbi:uncharacterized protein ACIQIH_007375 [Cyanocitta cristata]